MKVFNLCARFDVSSKTVSLGLGWWWVADNKGVEGFHLHYPYSSDEATKFLSQNPSPGMNYYATNSVISGNDDFQKTTYIEDIINSRLKPVFVAKSLPAHRSATE